MKQSKKLLSLILAAMMLCLSVFGVSAAELIEESLDMIIIGGEEEQEDLAPMMANECYYHSGKPYVPEGANLIREDDGENTSNAFLSHVRNLGYVKGTWKYKMQTWGTEYDIYECHYWYNSAYPGVYFYHS